MLEKIINLDMLSLLDKHRGREQRIDCRVSTEVAGCEQRIDCVNRELIA